MAASLTDHPLMQKPWYYRLELEPGLFTPGRERGNLAITRTLLAATGVADHRCLDVGTQEGLVPVLLARRGAAEILAYDRYLRSAQLELVREALGVEFGLTGDYKLAELPSRLREQGTEAFDVVVFSGVAYHMLDPLGGLVSVRGVVRDGGICIFETAIAFEDEVALYFNSGARFTPAGLWFMTPASVDYLLRFVGFEPLDVLYTRGKPEAPGKPAQGRIAVACRAVSETVADPGDALLEAASHGRDMAEFMDPAYVRSSAAPVAYERAGAELVARPAGGIDVAASVAATRPHPSDPPSRVLELGAEA